MNIKLRLAAAITGLGTCAIPLGHAEDIDIYTIPQTEKSAPNVLFILDNTSNWSSAGWRYDDVYAKCAGNETCEGYVNRIFDGKRSLTQGQVEAGAIKLVLEELVCKASDPDDINIGLMLMNESGVVDKVRGDVPRTPTGYIRHAIQEITPTSPACTGDNELLDDLNDVWKDINYPPFKAPASADYGNVLYEAFKYFGGYANTNNTAASAMGAPSGATGFGPTRNSLPSDLEDKDAFIPNSKEYKSPIDANSCGNNYIIFVGNGFPNLEYGSTSSDLNAPLPTNDVMEYLGLQPRQIPFLSGRNSTRFADEWAQFLARTDVSAVSGHQPVKTFTIDVKNGQSNPQVQAQSELLDNMAKYGGTGVGGSYRVDGDLGALVNALTNTLIQIAAVNSAFASASLPISVNTQGTYLNQVFIGMFRPDGSARPRWAGNLKQYQFQLTEDNTGGTIRREIFLADADKKAAVDNANTGFLQACARSFWTTNSTPSDYWKTVTEAPTPNYGIPQGSCTNNEMSDRPDGSIVERGGVAQGLRKATAGSRAIQTCDPSPANCTVSSAFAVSTDDEKWIRGDNVGDGYNSTSTISNTEKYDWRADSTKAITPYPIRPTIHGGVIHSRPLAINYGSSAAEDVVVFYGADDGLLRAISGNKADPESGPAAGSELWAFLPPEFEGRLKRNRDNFPFVQYGDLPDEPNKKGKDYFFDGSLGAYIGPENADGTGANVTHIYASMRRGGRMIYAFDATDHPKDSAPDPLWRFGCPTSANTGCYPDTTGSDVTKIGQTWSTPRIIRVKNQSTLYAVFGAGYDDCEDTDDPRDCSGSTTGHGLFVLDAASGAELRFIDFGSSAGHVVADPVAIDTNFDGFSDVLYAADTLGNLWRVNLNNPATVGTQDQDDWIVTHVAKVADWTNAERSRKFLYAPDVVTVGEYNIVLIGTGNREKPLETSETAKVKNRFYGIWDQYALTSTAFVTINDSGDCDAAGDLVMTSSSCQLMNTSDVTLNYLETFSNVATRPRGWVIDLDHTASGGPNEQVVTTAATVGGLVNFSTFQAKNLNACSNLGTARGYAACFLHGGASCDGPVAAGTTRSEMFVGGGLPPSPVAGVVEIDGNIVPFIIGGKPDAPGGSALEVKLPKIPIKKHRTKVYRYKQID